MDDLLIINNLRWTGHLMRISPDRLPKQMFYFQLSSDRIKYERLRLQFNDVDEKKCNLIRRYGVDVYDGFLT